jgi:alpha-galactosidase
MSKSARKITFIGAGSTVFAKNLIGDILSFPELADSTVCLYDIDENRLKSSEIVAKRIATTLGVPSKFEVTTNRSRALDGATYAINMIQVGGYRPCTVTDFEIPKRYGLRQTIADTLGIGGIMRAVRTIPVLIDMRGDGAALPGCRALQLRQSMAMVLALGGKTIRTIDCAIASEYRGRTRGGHRSAARGDQLRGCGNQSRRLFPSL